MRPICRRALSAAIVASLLLGGCVTFRKGNLLPSADRVIGLDRLDFLAPDQRIDMLPAAIPERAVTAYRVKTADARGVLLALGGNGNAAEPLLRALAPRARALGLDLVVYSYYVRGQSPPTTAETRAETHALLNAIAKTNTPQSKNIYVLGHSFGCWYAPQLAAEPSVRGLILASAGTTIAETFGQEFYPLNLIVHFGADADAGSLDAVRDAALVHAPTIIFSSKTDGVIPLAESQRVFAALPTATPKKFVTLEHVGHNAYLTQDRFWSDIGEFLDLRAAPAPPLR